MVSLPVMDAEPVDKLDNRFLITITTTDIEDQEPGLGHLGASSGGDCRVFFPGGPAVDAAELYDRAFSELDYLSGDQSHPWRYPDGHFEDVVLPTFYIQSDVYTPWRCVAGAIFIIEAAGYPEVGLLTQSSAID